MPKTQHATIQGPPTVTGYNPQAPLVPGVVNGHALTAKEL